MPTVPILSAQALTSLRWVTVRAESSRGVELCSVSRTTRLSKGDGELAEDSVGEELAVAIEFSASQKNIAKSAKKSTLRGQTPAKIQF